MCDIYQMNEKIDHFITSREDFIDTINRDNAINKTYYNLNQ